MHTTLTTRNASAPSDARMFLSFNEAVMLAEASEKRVRKDIETGMLKAPFVTRFRDSRLCFHWPYVFTLAAVYGNEGLPGGMRKRVLSGVNHYYFESKFSKDFDHVGNYGAADVGHCLGAQKEFNFFSSGGVTAEKCYIYLDKYLSLDFAKVVCEVKPRVDLYVSGLRRVEENPAILGGDAVFKDTRIPVKHIGQIAEKGEKTRHILEDYASLTLEDVEFAKLYLRANPPVGRPRLRPRNDGNDTGNTTG